MSTQCLSLSLRESPENLYIDWLICDTLIDDPFFKSNDKYMGHNNQDLDLFQRQFLFGLYECCSRKTK